MIQTSDRNNNQKPQKMKSLTQKSFKNVNGYEQIQLKKSTINFQTSSETQKSFKNKKGYHQIQIKKKNQKSTTTPKIMKTTQ